MVVIPLLNLFFNRLSTWLVTLDGVISHALNESCSIADRECNSQATYYRFSNSLITPFAV